MSNKIFITLLFFAITIPTFINHQVYGNSNITRSNYEGIRDIIHIQKKRKSAKVLADYMYERVKFYQKYNDDWYEQYYMLWEMYKAIQNME